MIHCAVVALACGLGMAQPHATVEPIVGRAAEPQVERARYRVSRADLGRTYLAFENAAANPQSDANPERLIAASKGFDAATGSFFSGDFPAAVRSLVDQIVTLRGGDAGLRLASSMRVRVSPRTLIAAPGTPGQARVRVSVARMFGPGADDERAIPLRVRIVSAQGATLGEERLLAPTGAEAVDVIVELRASETGTAKVLLGSGEQLVETARLAIVTRSMESQRTDAQQALASLAPAKSDLDTLARFISAWRAEQLTDTPPEDSSASVVIDYAALAQQVERECTALSRGENPYADAPGDWWLPARASGTPVPMRLYVPAGNPKVAPGPRALIVAVHGAGGDEHLFADGYGGGKIKALADKHGFIVAAPRAGLLTSSPEVFDAIVRTVSALHRIDSRRVYVLGHSMGGGVVTSWTMQRPRSIAACVSIAGVGSLARARTLPPVLAIAGELDPLVRPTRVQRDSQAATEAGLPVEYLLVPNAGHTLVVGASLAGAVDWLLSKSAPDAAP